ncbi:M48 family metallopeptidase [Glycomyces terrestris]|uniref:Peptidase M48 domain-containing protein n=1 Tax=Glycomyces terrestris TaxID=2493553 RepID=A0A426V355_9ACTN|nr:M48 family metallopeptidase [Glycomyces terrestris]RRS01258.1 hypothetical protein EIW28_00280 [Glycomyces terrestris]
MRDRTRTWWWLVLIGAVPAAMAAAAGAMVWFTVYAFTVSPVTAVRIAAAFTPPAAVLGLGLWMLVAPVDRPVAGVAVAERDEPELWALVRRLAAAAGTAPPHQIRVTADADAAVREDTRLLGLVATRRHLFVGAPLVAALRAGEFAAVLTHEFAHYANRDTRFAGAAYRSRRAFARTVAAAEHGDPLQRAVRFLLRPYGLLVLRASASLSRRQERAADEAAARATGSANTAAALRELAPIARSWAVFRRDHLLAGWDAGCLPADAFTGYARLRASLEDELERLRAAPPAGGEPFDTHPPLDERIAAVAALGAPGRVPVPAGPALGLLRDPARLLDAALLDALGPEAHAKRRVPWAELIREGALAALTADAGAVLAAAAAATGRPPAPEALLDALDAGLLLELGADPAAAPPLPDPPRVRRERARLSVRKGLHGAVVLALDAAGAVSWRESWPGPGAAVMDERLRAALPDLVDAAVADPPRTAPLRALLESIRPPAERPHHGTAAEDQDPRPDGDAQGRQAPRPVVRDVHGGRDRP